MEIQLSAQQKRKEKDNLCKIDIINKLLDKNYNKNQKSSRKIYEMKGKIKNKKVKVVLFPQAGIWKIQAKEINGDKYETTKFNYKENALFYFNYLARKYNLN